MTFNNVSNPFYFMQILIDVILCMEKFEVLDSLINDRWIHSEDFKALRVPNLCFKRFNSF